MILKLKRCKRSEIDERSIQHHENRSVHKQIEYCFLIECFSLLTWMCFFPPMYKYIGYYEISIISWNENRSKVGIVRCVSWNKNSNVFFYWIIVYFS